MTFKVKDHYFKKAKREKYLARSVYKLEEIDQKFNLLRRGQQVLDIGYYPGSWIQYILEKVGPEGSVYGVDIQPINKTLAAKKNVTLLQAGIEDFISYKDFKVVNPFDLICSDMAPATTGIKNVDQIKSLDLVEALFYKLPHLLRRDGHLVAKIFESQEARDFLARNKKIFSKMKSFKPKSTRSISKEFYIIGLGYLDA